MNKLKSILRFIWKWVIKPVMTGVFFLVGSVPSLFGVVSSSLWFAFKAGWDIVSVQFNKK